jgi:hypothetical protein
MMSLSPICASYCCKANSRLLAECQQPQNLSVSIVRDYAVAAMVTLRELMQRYLAELVPRTRLTAMPGCAKSGK